MLGKHLILIGRVLGSGIERAEVGTFLLEAKEVASKDARIADVLNVPVQRCPTPVARNLLVHQAQKYGASVVVMVDDDMGPAEGFFKEAVYFLLEHDGPAVIASPYCCAPPEERVMAFEWSAAQSHSPDAAWAVCNIDRESAARRKGIERVANIGTGLIAYRTDAFARVEPPYFDYQYGEKEHVSVTETEDCFCHRRLALSGVPIYCAWDHWSSHYKIKRVMKPEPIEGADVADRIKGEALANLKAGIRAEALAEIGAQQQAEARRKLYAACKPGEKMEHGKHLHVFGPSAARVAFVPQCGEQVPLPAAPAEMSYQSAFATVADVERLRDIVGKLDAIEAERTNEEPEKVGHWCMTVAPDTEEAEAARAEEYRNEIQAEDERAERENWAKAVAKSYPSMATASVPESNDPAAQAALDRERMRDKCITRAPSGSGGEPFECSGPIASIAFSPEEVPPPGPDRDGSVSPVAELDVKAVLAAASKSAADRARARMTRRYLADCTYVGVRPELPPSRAPFAPAIAATWAVSVPGWATRDELLWLAEHAAGLPQDGKWVELGTWKGRSFAATYLAAPAGSTLFAVDTWKGSESERSTNHAEAAAPGDAVFDDFISLKGELQRLRQRTVSAPVNRRESALTAGLAPASVDAVYVDAAHDYGSVVADIEAWLPMLKGGGLLCGHDRNEEGVRDALRYLASQYGLAAQDGPGSLWWLRLPAEYRHSVTFGQDEAA